MTNTRIKVGSVAFLRAAGSGYGIGLTDDGHRVEFLGDWSALADLRARLDAGEAIHIEIESWQVLAIDDEIRIPLPREALAERAAFIRSALDKSAR
jgi:hypothetical protein